MKHVLRSATNAVTAAVFAAVLYHGAMAQDAPAKEVKAPESKGLPPRATPAEYQTRTPLGPLTLAAEFTGHSINTPGSVTLSNEDYVAVEVAFFGPPDAHVSLSDADFSLRVNGKKPVPAQQYLMVFGSLKDPEWQAPEEIADKKAGGGGSTSIGTGGGQSDAGSTPKVYHPPMALARSWQQTVQKAALPEGDRALPTAGLIFFKYHGKCDASTPWELDYKGSAGKAVIKVNQ